MPDSQVNAPTLDEIRDAARYPWQNRDYFFRDGKLWALSLRVDEPSLRCIGPLEELVALRPPEWSRPATAPDAEPAEPKPAGDLK